jgi:uncharacterized protein YndB with AHSA1/START domain
MDKIDISSTKAVGRELAFTHPLDAPRHLVFKAWTDPAVLARWWGPHGFTNPVCELDVQTGGTLRIVTRGPDGNRTVIIGVYLIINAPERLAFTSTTLDKEGKALFQALNIVTFAKRDDKTTMTLLSRIVKPIPETVTDLVKMEQNWSQSLERLSGELTKMN